MDAPHSTRAARILAQHAETCRLLGVDFIPCYGPGVTLAPHDASAPPVPVAEAADDRPRAAPSTPAAESRKPSGFVEPSPRRMPPQAAPLAPSVTPPPSRPRADPSERDRVEAQARLDSLRARYEADAPHNNFVTSFRNIVFGEGDPCPRLVFVGEAPGEDEDLTGRPFVGRAGQLLDRMIGAMGLRREEVYICNVLKTRPPNNRTPTSDEVAACKPYLLEQLAILQPEVIVALGLCSTHALLDTDQPMGKLRGRWMQIADSSGRMIPVMPTYHPSYLLRAPTPDNRAKVWADLQLAMERLGLRRPPASPKT